MSTKQISILKTDQEARGAGFMDSYTFKILEKFGFPVFLAILLLWNQYQVQSFFMSELNRRNDDTREIIRVLGEQSRTLSEIREDLRRK